MLSIAWTKHTTRQGRKPKARAIVAEASKPPIPLHKSSIVKTGITASEPG